MSRVAGSKKRGKNSSFTSRQSSTRSKNSTRSKSSTRSHRNNVASSSAATSDTLGARQPRRRSTPSANSSPPSVASRRRIGRRMQGGVSTSGDDDDTFAAFNCKLGETTPIAVVSETSINIQNAPIGIPRLDHEIVGLPEKMYDASYIGRNTGGMKVNWSCNW